MKSARIRGYSGPYFPVIGLNTDQNNTEYEHVLSSEIRYSLKYAYYISCFSLKVCLEYA